LARLAERGAPTGKDIKALAFNIISDPEHKELEKGGDIFLKKEKEWEVSGDYTMVQPAVVVTGPDGVVMDKCSWSWKTMNAEYTTDDNMKMVPTEEWSQKELGVPPEVPLVLLRPYMQDMPAFIEEGRCLKLSIAMPMPKPEATPTPEAAPAA